MVTGLVVKKTITISNILIRIRLLVLSSKQTYLCVVEQLITEKENYQQVTRENCGGVIMKVIVMKLEIIQLRCKHINTYSKDTCEDIVTYKVS